MSDLSAPASEPAPRIATMSGKDMGLYAMMLLVWGTSWIAISAQVGIVPPMISGVIRFSIASLVIFIWLRMRGDQIAFPWRTHLRFALLGVLIFSSNFMLFYYAASYMASGLMAVIFSLASLFNIVLSLIFFGQKPPRAGLVGALLGFAGIGLIFWPEIVASASHEGVLTGLALGIAGTLSFCLGNMVASSNNRAGVPLLSANAWGMFYGTLWMAFLAIVLDMPLVMEWSVKYWVAMVWLTLGASVLAFWGYMTLLKNIGPARTGYLTVLFPIVALAISTVFEGYQWTWMGLVGLAAIIAGNILVMGGKRPA